MMTLQDWTDAEKLVVERRQRRRGASKDFKLLTAMDNVGVTFVGTDEYGWSDGDYERAGVGSPPWFMRPIVPGGTT